MFGVSGLHQAGESWGQRAHGVGISGGIAAQAKYCWVTQGDGEQFVWWKMKLDSILVPKWKHLECHESQSMDQGLTLCHTEELLGVHIPSDNQVIGDGTRLHSKTSGDFEAGRPGRDHTLRNFIDIWKPLGKWHMEGIEEWGLEIGPYPRDHTAQKACFWIRAGFGKWWPVPNLAHCQPL